MKIFLSPSPQKYNVGAYKNTTEYDVCNAISNSIYYKLINDYDVDIMKAEQVASVDKRVAYANENNVDLYLIIHTNAAANTSVRGTESFYRANDEKGKEFATVLAKNFATKYNIPYRRTIPQTFYELKNSTVPTVYIELDFHSNPAGAEFLQNNTKEIGEFIGEELINYYKIPKRSKSNNSVVLQELKNRIANINNELDRMYNDIKEMLHNG